VGAVQGEGLPVAPVPRIVERRGCDAAPIDATSAAGRLRLLSFVWPDHPERFRRLQGALAVAARTPVTVDRAPLGSWITGQLAGPVPEPDVLTVVWHSIVMQYVAADEQEQVSDALADAATRMPLVRLAMEAPIAPYETAPELRLDGRLLAGVGAHGVPVELVPPPH
jgi:hypothetical protein